MAGYAYPVGATTADTGTATGVTEQIASANTLTTIFTATAKTRVNSVLVTNASGGILPVELYVYRDSTDSTFLLSRVRVFRSEYLLLPLVSGDSRVDESVETPGVNKPLTELVLQVGDIVKAKCPKAASINVTLDLKEGIK